MEPQIAVYETETAIVLAGNIPGVKIQDIAVQSDELAIVGTHGHAQFAQTITLPCAVDHDQVICVQEDSELRIVVQKAEAA